MYRKIATHLLTSLFLVSQMSCGSASGTSGSDTSPSITTLEALPQASAPVEASSSVAALTRSAPNFAVTGMPYDNMEADFFGAGSSLAACEMYNMSKQTIAQAGQGDLVLCYVKKIMLAAMQAGVTTIYGQPVDIYDGQPHVFAVDFSGTAEDDNNGNMLVRLTVGQDFTGNITDFEMKTCEGGSQKEYLHQTITGNEFSMIQKGVRPDGTGTNLTEVTGTLNENAHFVGAKTINISFTDTFDGQSQYGVSHFTQSADSLLMDGYRNGAYTDQGTGKYMTYVNQIVGKMGLLDQNSDSGRYDLGLLALGDGGILGQWSGNNGDQDWSYAIREGWNGDTGAVDESAAADYFAAIDGLAFPESTQPQITFNGDENFDCNTVPEATLSMAELNVNLNSCSNLTLDHEWINCWQAVAQAEAEASEFPSLADIRANLTEKFIIEDTDWEHISRTEPFFGTESACAHTGGHINFESLEEDYTIDIIAPYDGIVTRVDNCVPIPETGTDRYGVDIAFANNNGADVILTYSIEPQDGTHCAGAGQDPNAYSQYILVEENENVTKGQVIARMIKYANGNDNAHVHFDVMQAGSQTKVCPNIFNADVTEEFGNHYGSTTCNHEPLTESTFCYQPGFGEDIMTE